MPKYRDIFRQMIADHEAKFASFKEVHDKYALDSKTWQKEYNQQGAEIVDLIRNYEQKLCMGQEKGNKSVFSSKLADKFWTEVKAFFPLIDFVGAEIK
jgi:hypothetical protein